MITLLLLLAASRLGSCSAAAAGHNIEQQLYERGLQADDSYAHDSLVHEAFSRTFTKRSLSVAVDEIIGRLIREEQECLQRQEQCDDTDQGGDQGADQGGHGQPDNIIMPPTKKPDTNDQEQGQGGQDQGQGQGQGGQDQGQGQGQGGGDGGDQNEAPAPGKSFYIESKFSGKVLEITPGGAVEGAKIQMWDKRGSNDKHQLWYVGEDQFISSALERGMGFSDSSKENRLVQAFRDLLNGRVPHPGLHEANEREGDLSGLEMHPIKSSYLGGKWKWSGDQIVNEAGFALTIRDASRENGARLIQHTTDPEGHKTWKAVYVG